MMYSLVGPLPAPDVQTRLSQGIEILYQTPNTGRNTFDESCEPESVFVNNDEEKDPLAAFDRKYTARAIVAGA